MIYLIRTSTTESWYEQTVLLDGVSFRVRLMWSERERRWYFDLYTAGGTALILGKKVVADHPLNLRLTSDLRPAGVLMCIDQSGSETDPDLRDLGSRCALVYLDEDSVEEASA